MGTRLRGISAAAVAAMLVATGTTARADILQNKFDATVAAEPEVLTLNVGSDPSEFRLFLDKANGDGKSGCNLTGPNDVVRISMTSSRPDVATLSSSELTLTNCGPSDALFVTPVGIGSTIVSFGLVANTTQGTFDLTGATFTVVVAEPASENSAPTIDVTGVTSGAEYEIGAVPTAGCQVSDVEDGSSSFPATLSALDGTLAQYGLGSQTATCRYTDAGGLTAITSVTYSIVDTTAPVITFQSRIPAANVHGWNNTAVAVAWSCTDSGSGVVADTVETIVTDEGSARTAAGTCADHAGNTASDTVTGINIDRMGPTVAWTGGPADGASHYFGSVPSAPTCEAVDELSGGHACDVSGYGTTVGPHTLTAVATDLAGNTTTATRSYSVLAWTLKGFYQPVDMGGVVNTVKAGSTVPLKFEVFAGTELTSTAAVASFTQTAINCSTTAASDEVELTTTGGTALRYDSTAGQFVQNWQTPKVVGACYRVTMTTQDGSYLTASFRLK